MKSKSHSHSVAHCSAKSNIQIAGEEEMTAK
jgi:hypothetical protein